jgi:diguanylate cyclase (GGDEF)-like protein
MIDPADKTRYSIETWITLTVSAAMILVALIAAGIHLQGVARRNRVDDRVHLSAYAALLADRAADDLQPANRDTAPDWTPRAAAPIGLRAVAVLNPNGRLLYGFPSPEFLNQFLNAAEIPNHPEPIPVDFQVAAQNLRCLLVAKPIVSPSEDQPVGTIVIAMDRTPLDLRAELTTLMTILACAVVLNFLMLNDLNRRLITPIHRLAAINKTRIDADLAKLERSWSTDEFQRIGQLIRHLNQNLENTRQDVADLESTVDRRVDARTRQITTALKQSQKQSWTDPLTKLHNRRVLEERLGPILAAQRDAGQDLSAVIIDVDHFKQLNDRLGHPAGDALLEFIGQLLRGTLREPDLAVRYGGDEFVLVLPATSAKEALCVAKRIIALFAQHAAAFDIDPKPSLSAGIASLRTADIRHPDQLLQLADRALYTAKQNGKSTAVIHNQTPVLA